MLSPSNGQTANTILQQAPLIKRTINQRGTCVRSERDDVLVIVTHDFELFLVLNYLVPLCVPSLLVLNVAMVDRSLRILFNAAPDVVSTLIFIVAVIVLDVVLANWVPGMMRRSRAAGDGD